MPNQQLKMRSIQPRAIDLGDSARRASQIAAHGSLVVDDATHASPPCSTRVALHTLGCRLNAAETMLLQGRLTQRGWQIVDWDAQADVYVLNSCTVTAQADAHSRQVLRGVRARNAAAQIVVTGCYAEAPHGKATLPALADLVVGNGEKLRLAEHVTAFADAAAATDRSPGPLRGLGKVIAPRISRSPFRLGEQGLPWPLTQSQKRTRAHLKVQDGCDFMCSFCIIPRTRGRARARDFEDALAQAKACVRAGVREIVLSGVNLGTYAHCSRGLCDLLDALNRLHWLARIRVSSLEPGTIPAGLFERMADAGHKLAPFLHMPLQSGADRVLQAMRRRYDASLWRRLAEQALREVPALWLSTDVMAGFPMESASDFAETEALLRGLPLAGLHVFPFSSRPGTAAARMPQLVSSALRRERAMRLRELGEAKREAFYRAHQGQEAQVLFEVPRDANSVRGYTANYIRVELRLPHPERLRNRMRRVRLQQGEAQYMRGTLLPHTARLPRESAAC